MKSVNCIKCLHHSCAQYSLQDVWVYVCAGVHTHMNILALENMFCLKFCVTFRKMMIHWTIYRMSLCYCHFNWRAHFLVFYYHNDFGRLICVVFKTKFLISHIMIIMSWQLYLCFVISNFYHYIFISYIVQSFLDWNISKIDIMERIISSKKVHLLNIKCLSLCNISTAKFFIADVIVGIFIRHPFSFGHIS